MAERLRGGAGQRQRIRRLKAEPFCRLCKERGIVTASTVPDHIQPLAQGGTDDDSNIRCLCHPCHLEVTAEQFGHRTTRAVAADGWPIEIDPAKTLGKPPFRSASAPCARKNVASSRKK